MKSGKFMYGADDTKITNLSNYSKSYEPPKQLMKKPYVDNNPIQQSFHVSNSYNDTKLMEKINYMIHLLEEQQNEKTSNITEEFILYTFLGVFIIYIVDSFARSGKYIR
jgi:hypothetical protein